jgi:hypothetical protein
MHRLEVAGYAGSPLFTQEALVLIASESGGIPRRINNLCFNSLSIGFALRKQRIDRAVVEEAVADLGLEAPSTQSVCRPEAHRMEKQSVPLSFHLLAEETTTAGKRRYKISARGVLALRVATVLLALVLTGLSFLSARRAAREVELPLASRLAAAEPVPFESLSPGDPMSSTPTTEAVREAAPAEPDSRAWSIVVVQSRQTLGQISLRRLGGYNPQLLAHIRALNPRLLDPDHIEVGQEIRLPLKTVQERSSDEEEVITASTLGIRP